MIRKLVDFALNNRFLILVMAFFLFGWGAISFHNLPVEAYPDVANNYVTVITQWPGRASEEVEQQVTVPLEIAFAGIPHMSHLRSASLAGLSSVTMVFDDDSENDWNREKVLERLSQVTLPTGLQPQIGTDWSPVGQIFWYTLESSDPKYDTMALKSLEDWTLEKNFRSVPGVVDVSSFGGITREYQVILDPEKLVSYGLSISQVKQQIAANNVNAGGSFIEQGAQQINVREIGLFTSTHDIGNTVLKAQNGTALKVSDIATVVQGPKIRLGQIGKTIRRVDGKLADNSDAIEGVLLLQKGANSDETLEAIHAKVKELNERVLPKGVKVVAFLDRSNLLELTTHTVMHNLTEGIVLVVVILFVFLGNLRGALIVALTIPFALLFASICLDLRHIPANLLSLGALDFGMVVDGAVVMIENIVRHLSHSRKKDMTVTEQIREAAHEVQRPVFYAIGIIITAYLPIFTLQSVEGRLFKPMSWTVAFALLGALIFSMLLAPVLASFLFRNGATEWENPILRWLTNRYRHAATFAIEHRAITFSVAGLALLTSILMVTTGVIGSEFLPHLDEGAIWVRGTLAPSTGPTESLAVANRARIILASFPEVKQVVSQIGRPDDGTDTTGFFNTEYYVDLKQKQDWRPVFKENKEELISAINRQLDVIPGVIWNFSQPISDNVEEAVSGVKGELAVKIYGDDLKTLEQKGDAIVNVMSTIRGVQDLGLFRVIGQPNLNFVVDRDAAARFGINVADIQDAIESAVGGNAVTQVLDGEARYDVTVRYNPQFRATPESIENIRLVSPSGERVSLAQVTKLKTEDGAEEITRENGQRYVAIKYSVRNRDLGSTVQEAIDKVSKQVPLPPGYKTDWAGEYESQKRSSRRLLIVLPITLGLIFMILYSMFGSFKWAALILCNLAMAPIGGLLALLVTRTHFSVSSGVGFLALFGVSVQTGIIMLEYINQMRVAGHSVESAAIEGAVLRLRPILMTMLVATLGLLPAALSHGIGSDSQRPFAIVIVGGLVGALLISVFLLPTLYVWIARDTDVLPIRDEEFEA
ncbi:efflux RND transporter permease subunit [Granulicella tundricola]|uniref:Heavy metal efflux pump, CzcA family n=1 Tax=Granulicella tundricola (strain ATCC BAA-1859 / DSM 23138 / MP5ACTX9) TaxID=1198114 RepID=E8WZV3_GRATM|nr:CusA/CzcA family heavy metal efflux RND transporter [Granulicella tundricola]ADW67764.1 heavy metal efflux pump, CzcA family [Granulicella tundricola MP5ACTX9]